MAFSVLNVVTLLTVLMLLNVLTVLTILTLLTVLILLNVMTVLTALTILTVLTVPTVLTAPTVLTVNKKLHEMAKIAVHLETDPYTHVYYQVVTKQKEIDKSGLFLFYYNHILSFSFLNLFLKCMVIPQSYISGNTQDMRYEENNKVISQ